MDATGKWERSASCVQALCPRRHTAALRTDDGWRGTSGGRRGSSWLRLRARPQPVPEGHTYYLFSTGAPAAASATATSRSAPPPTCGTGGTPAPCSRTSRPGSPPRSAIPNLWAPDISFFDGLWHLYYAGSSFGSNNSVIGLATTPTLDPPSPRYHWTDDGLVFRQHRGRLQRDRPVAGHRGRRRQVAGVRVVLERDQAAPAGRGDRQAGQRHADLYSLAQRPAPDADEGAGITYHAGYYYLFVSFDTCCRDRQHVPHHGRRTRQITGPYLDHAGNRMDLGRRHPTAGRRGR